SSCNIAYKRTIIMRSKVPAFLVAFVLAVGLPKVAVAQQIVPMHAALGLSDSVPALNIVAAHPEPAPLLPPVRLPRMAPDLALQVMANHAIIQDAHLGSYSAISTVTAKLPD